ncbi:MAG: hypothetical protein U0R78_05245 [Nocardioidaceae bacterium]
MSELNRTGLHGHWSGYLSALRYGAAKHECFGVRNSAGLFDSSPLYKHRIAAPMPSLPRRRDGARRAHLPGKAQYTVWCDEEGYLLEDGVLFRHSETEFCSPAPSPTSATSATSRPASASPSTLASPRRTACWRSRAALPRDPHPAHPDVAGLPFFGMAETTIEVPR